MPEQETGILGPDLIGEFHRIVVAELQTWADEAGEEMDRLRGRELAAKRASLRALRAEIRAVCAEIERREATWTAGNYAVALQRASLSTGLWHLGTDAAKG